MFNSRNILLCISLVGLGAASTATLAQQSTSGNTTGKFGYKIEEIVVTAQKRNENLQDIPKQVQVVSTGEMSNNNVTDIATLTKLVPSMNGYNGLGHGGKTSMRGVGTAAPNIGAESKVGITIDGVPVPSRATGVQALVDIQQVEVLPGPQGTLAGRNATGGLINLVTRKPNQDHFSANVQAKTTNDNEYQVGTFLTGPLSSSLAYSFSAQKQYLRGLAYNIRTKKWDVAKDLGMARGKLLWTPDSQSDVTLTYTHSQWNIYGGGSSAFGKVMSKLDIPPDQLYSALERTPTAPTSADAGVLDSKQTFNDLYPGLYKYIGPNNYRYSSTGRASEERKTDMATLTYDRDLADGTFTVIGSWLDETFPRLQNWSDYPLGNLDIRPDFDGYAHLINYAHQKTLETRFVSNTDQKVSYIAGLFWSQEENRYDYTRLYLPFSANRIFGNHTAAAFGNMTYNLTEDTAIKAGVRYEKDKIYYSWVYRDIPATTKTLDNGVVLNFNEVWYPSTKANNSDSYVNYDLGIDHHFNDNLMVYLNYASANQGPIYDAEYIQGSQDGTPLTPLPSEEVSSIESGVKATVADGRVTVNANVFDMKFKNYQALTNVTDPTNPTSQPILKTYAAGSVISQGLELTMTAYLTDAFRLDLAGLLNKAEIDKWLNAPCYSGQTAAEGCVTGIPPGELVSRKYQPNIAGNRLADAAKVRFTAVGTYSGTIDNLFGGTAYDLSLTVAHTGDTIGDQLGNPETRSPARTDVDANFAFTHGPLTLSFFGVNLTKAGKETYRSGLRGALRTEATNPYPLSAAVQRNMDRNVNRYLGIRFRYNFNE